MSYLTALLIAVVAAGCGSGGGSGNSDSVSDVANLFYVTARVGPIVAVRVGETAILSGSTSDTSSDQPLTYNWAFSLKPETSNAALLNPDTADPSFVADVEGTYSVQLVVIAEGISSVRAIQLVVATIAPDRPTGPFNHTGLSSSCLNCHNDDFDTIQSKIGDHAAAGNNCEACHSPLGFDIVPDIDHREVFGNCSQCHDGIIAVGKSEFHQPTNAECDDCHNTVSFLDLGPNGEFDHSGISRACTGCHNGVISIGMTPTTADVPPGTHPDTDSECGYCHTTESFLNAYPDHTGPLVNGPGITCDSCHNGTTAQGTSAGHPDTSPAGDCIACHSIATFSLDGVFNHRIDPAMLACEVCHSEPNSFAAPGKTPTTLHNSTTADCGSCHSTDAFTPAFSVDHTDPVVLAQRCDVCHGVNATGQHANHLDTTITNPGIPTPPNNRDCVDCHTPGTFTTGTFDHDFSIYSPTPVCSVCHNEVISVGKLPNHFPTPNPADECDVCHDIIDFAGATFDHVGIAGNDCTSCHNGTFTTTTSTLYGKPASHIPTNQDCSLCHTTAEPFVVASPFNHTGITDNCQSCHNGNPSFVGIGAIGKKVNHIPAVNTCDTCHADTNSGGFASPATFLATIHAGLTTGCAGCHDSSFLPLQLVKDTTHLPTGQDCDLCHTVAGFTPSIFAHSGISGNCSSCHDGNVNYVAQGALGKTPDHPVTTSDCGVCHNTSDFSDVFDHTGRIDNCVECHGDGAVGAVTKKNPGHVPTTQDCSVCHVPGTFAPAVFDHTGIVNNCVSCHDGITATGKDAKVNPAHIPTTEDCSVCHVPTSFSQANFDHQNIVNNCVNCHDGTTVTGKDGNHVPTNEDCVVCHQTTGFLPATFSHAGIVDNCFSCHDAGLATPKDSNHVPTTQDCGVCHNTSAFVPATFDHTGIVNNCDSCHGVTAQGKSPNHLSTNLDCYFCHTTATFAGGSWIHDSSTANNCDTCHINGGGATPKPSGHLSTNEQCDVCHTTNGWAPTDFSHSPGGNYPGDHRRDPGCNGCHRGAIGAGINSDNYPNQLQYAPDCAGCHARDFERKGDHIGGENGTLSQNRDCSGGGNGCHRVRDKDFD